jgi:DNA-binding LacI/PurR family transcriptional regulator/DNA-binding transcriptional regulator YhcF (GntR family)
MPGLTGVKPVTAKSGAPLYVAVRDAVHDAIERGDIGPGERLPSTKKLSEQLDVSLVTVHRALNELVTSGVLRRGRGRGTFVHEDFAKPHHIASDVRFGLVFHPESTLADPYHGRLLQAVRDAATERGIDLVLLRYDEDWRKECAGFLYVNPFPDQLERGPSAWAGRSSHARGLRAGPAPVVGIGVTPTGGSDIVAVDTDNVSMMRRAVELMVSHGHRRIVYLGSRSASSNNIDRERGFVEGCEAAGIEVDESRLVRSSLWRLSEAESGYLADLLTGPDHPTAIVAAGYYLALDVYAAARRIGLSIPDQLSVTGVDDPPSAECLSPPLTTFWQPLEELGRRAVDMLAQSLDPDAPRPEGCVLESVLKRRESVADVPPDGRDAPRRG